MGYIDVHHHFLTERRVAWKESGEIAPGLRLPLWTEDLDVAFLDRHNIDIAILSLSAPGVSICSSSEQAAALAREMNEQAATFRDRHRTRFGFLATLPLNNSLAVGIEEARYVLDNLGADGVTLFTSYEGRYLGHPDFVPLWEELDRRGAVVFVHPTAPAGDLRLPRAPTDNQDMVPRPIIDFPHETTRAAVHLITSNVVRNYPNCKIILSHGGGTLPYVATRIASLAAGADLINKTPEEFLVDAKTFYFDLALTGFKDPLGLLVNFATEGHILWGSDYPFARDKTVETQVMELESAGLASETRDSIARGAALKLFPRLGSL
ncbi:hypothetical protein S40285_07281 [Stachybotrys chlorohalonatus IBT 40285]|uniref:6-methylsalicylate decarboxylase n=1 Tax=Stachybotrys chlorohalonatus (strain IBT 40285) TaxID=1283841 RepID=A0A084R012_STAC4|nr:hypothetical protein S40285_07281 [Stachybotrys chlorohalonata IBT 40285]